MNLLGCSRWRGEILCSYTKLVGQPPRPALFRPYYRGHVPYRGPSSPVTGPTLGGALLGFPHEPAWRMYVGRDPGADTVVQILGRGLWVQRELVRGYPRSGK